MRASIQVDNSDSYSQQADEEFKKPSFKRFSSDIKSQQTLRKRTHTRKYAQEEESSESLQIESENDENSNLTYYQGGKIEKIFDTRIRQGTQEEERLCKLASKSFLHLQWLTKKQIEERNIQDTKFYNRQLDKFQEQIQTVQHKYGKQCLFNPAYKRVDRILTAAILFPVMHHKKATELNGKWSQSLALVCSKLINFQKYNIPYGIIQKEEYEPQEITKYGLKNPIKLQHILNRVYLDRYQFPFQFWKDVGQSIRNMEKVHKGTHFEHDANIIKEGVIFLYWQWFVFNRQRYYKVAQQLQNKFKTFKIKEENVNFKCSSGQIQWNSYISYNIFLNQKKVQLPNSDKQLSRLNPGHFSYEWLSKNQEYREHCFNFLTKQDFNKLELNKENDNLFLVKWCELDYDQATWQKQSDLIDYADKIKNFRLYSKVPPKKIRDKIQQNKKYHKLILSQMKGQSKEKPDVLDRYRRRLYCLSYKQQFKQYGGKDIPIYKDYKMLKPFQLQGLNWLIRGWHQKRNCILADQMGLGKTIQTIAFLNHLTIFQDVIGPFLVVAPVSTLKQWRVQIQQWSDMNCVLFKGKNSCRQLIEQYQFYHKFVTNQGFFVKFQKLLRFQVFLTNYELFLSEFDLIQKLPFQYIIIDQAHRIKNQKTRLAVLLRKLPCPRILLLTGTPIQNNTCQLWGLLNVIEPKRFNSFDEFKKKFGLIKNNTDLKFLKETLKPYLLRRVKSDVEKTIPKLSQTLVTLDLTKVQKAYYKGIIQKNKNQLINSLASINLNNLTLLLRQCCNHPYMLSQQICEQLEKNSMDDQQKIKKFVECSSKMIFVHKFLTRCKQNNQKSLIFTQFRDMVQFLCDYCDYHNIKYEWLDGNIDYEERHTRIDRFNKHPDVLVFIISTKAGGVGINLTSATNIIIYDSDWNPQNDLQAIARAHRIGQRKTVSVYRLITNQTYEQIIYKTAVKKMGIGLAILDDEYFTTNQDAGTNKKRKGRTNEQIQKLLRDGVVGFLKNENQQDGNLENISIEQIIKKSGKAVDYETKQCSYTSAKFQYDEGKELNIDDPNFWQVALKDIESPLQKLVKKLKMNSDTRESILNDVDLQAKLLLEANQIIYDLIKSKISMNNFNAQDERQLKGFLQQITDSRLFHRGFKKIANEWLQQIQKPSRRFEKLKPADILKISGKKQSKQQLMQNLKIKSRPKKRQNAQHNILKLSSSSENQQYEQSDQKQSQLNRQKQQNKVQSKKNKQKSKSDYKQKQKYKNSKNNIKNTQVQNNQIEFGSLLSGLCGICEKKRCSLICDGFCNRMFHAGCYRKFANNQTIQGNQHQKQLTMNLQQLNQNLSQQFYCSQCSANQGTCFICKKKQSAIIFVPKGKSYKRPKISQSQKREDNNYFDKVMTTITNQQTNKVYQCRLSTCSKFYHIQCLKQLKDSMCFEIDYIKVDKYYPLKCPRHFCLICQKPSSSIGWSCVRCPIAFHTKCMNQFKSQYIKVSEQNIICKSHLTQQQILIFEQKKSKKLAKAHLSSEDQEQDNEEKKQQENKKTKKQRLQQKKQEFIQQKSQQRKIQKSNVIDDKKQNAQ